MYRILVVDDEELIRRSIVRKLRRGSIPIGLLEEAGSGEEAYALARKNEFDILLCDIRMGDVNGLSLCGRLLRLQPKLKIVIISGYNQFDYARKALLLHAVDFLLKPVDAYELYHSVNLCVKLIEKEKTESLPRSVSDYLSRAGELQKLIEDCRESGEDAAPHIFPGNAGTGYSCARIYFTPEAQSRSEDIWQESFTELIEQPQPWKMAAAAARGGYFLIFALPGSQAAFHDREIEDMLRTLARRLNSREAYTCTVGYSGPCRLLGDAVEEAAAAMKYRVLLEDNEFIRREDAAGRKGRFSLDSKTLLTLQFALRTGRYGSAQQTLSGVCRDLENSGISYSSCRNLYLQLQLLAGEELLDMPALADRELYSFPSVKAMLNEFSAIFMEHSAKCSPSEKKPKETLIDQAKSFLNENLADSVTLEQTAELLHISPGYLSILFKEVAGVNFQEYLMNIRIEYAKELLSESGCSIKDVAAMSGFNNQHYFSNVFKRLTALTPREYRQFIKL